MIPSDRRPLVVERLAVEAWDSSHLESLARSIADITVRRDTERNDTPPCSWVRLQR